MFLDLHVGSLIEPVTGRRWDRRCIQREFHHRLQYFQDHGLAPADHVFIHYGNTAEFFVDLLAIWSLGGCAIPLDPRLSHFEIETLARAAAPRFSLWQGEIETAIGTRLSALGIKVLPTAAPAEETGSIQPRPYSSSLVSLDRPALILFTSGTTGQPKGVVHTHRSLRARWMSLRQCLGIEQFRRTLCLLPTHFGHGLICNCLFPWLSGQDLFIAPPFRPELVMQLGSLNVTPCWYGLFAVQSLTVPGFLPAGDCWTWTAGTCGCCIPCTGELAYQCPLPQIIHFQAY